MPPWLKILLILFAAGLLLLGTLLFFGWRWFEANKGELRDMGAKSGEEGMRFGEGKTTGACVAETLTRGDRCGPVGMMCEVRVKLFLQGCLQTATAPPDFCRGVPKELDVIGSVRWQMAECKRLGHPNEQRCTRLLQDVQSYCDQPR